MILVVVRQPVQPTAPPTPPAPPTNSEECGKKPASRRKSSPKNRLHSRRKNSPNNRLQEKRKRSKDCRSLSRLTCRNFRIRYCTQDLSTLRFSSVCRPRIPCSPPSSVQLPVVGRAMAKKAKQAASVPTGQPAVHKTKQTGALAKSPKQKGSRPPVKHVAAAVEKACEFAAMLERGTQAKLEKEAASLKARADVAAGAAVGTGAGAGGSGGGSGGKAPKGEKAARARLQATAEAAAAAAAAAAEDVPKEKKRAERAAAPAAGAAVGADKAPKMKKVAPAAVGRGGSGGDDGAKDAVDEEEIRNPAAVRRAAARDEAPLCVRA